MALPREVSRHRSSGIWSYIEVYWEGSSLLRETSPMPLSPTPSQSAASRAHGALSRGPVPPEGKAGSAANAPAARHGLRGAGPFRLLADEDGSAFQALLDDLLARHAPVGAAERHCVEQLAHAYWRERSLAALDGRGRL